MKNMKKMRKLIAPIIIAIAGPSLAAADDHAKPPNSINDPSLFQVLVTDNEGRAVINAQTKVRGYGPAPFSVTKDIPFTSESYQGEDGVSYSNKRDVKEGNAIELRVLSVQGNKAEVLVKWNCTHLDKMGHAQANGLSIDLPNVSEQSISEKVTLTQGNPLIIGRTRFDGDNNYQLSIKLMAKS